MLCPAMAGPGKQPSKLPPVKNSSEEVGIWSSDTRTLIFKHLCSRFTLSVCCQLLWVTCSRFGQTRQFDRSVTRIFYLMHGHTYPNVLCPVVPSIPVDDKNCFNLDSCAKVDCQPWKRFFWRVTDVPCLPFIHANNAIDTIGCIITTRHCARHHCIYRPQFQSWNCNLDDGHVKFKMSNTPFTLCVVAHHILYFLSLKPFPREPGGK